MKKILLVFGLLFFTVYLQAQIVTIPDNNFRTKLLTYIPAIDTNADGQIQVSEALAVTTLNVSSRSISNATGISAFTNLQSLDISSNLLTTLDVTSLIHLTSLDCYSNQLTTINVSTLTNLIRLYCFQNQLTSLDVSNLLNLQNLYCTNNQLTTLDTNLPRLRMVLCGANLFTSLDFSHGGEIAMNNSFSLNFSGNQYLTYVNLKNPGLLPTGNLDFDPSNCPALRYICVNENYISDAIFQLYYQNDPTITPSPADNVQINSYCSFFPSGNYNTLTGNVKLDINNNGCDANDIPLNNVKLFINDGTNLGATYTNATGNASFYTQAGNFVITPNFENLFFTISPASATLNFASSNSTTQTQNFCVTSLGIHKDLDIVIIPMTSARPGFDASYRLVYKNKGNQIQSGNINLNFDDAVLDFVSANPMTVSQSLDNLNWNFINLNPFESRTIDFVLNINSPQETPAVNINDLLSYLATISPTLNDETIGDNTSNLRQTVIGSFDPNDKTCVEGNTITPEKVGDYLHYVIRFQNSGTAAAQNIVVKDIIDTAKFDINTLQLTNSPHPNVTRITGNKVEFIFENINLPAEVNNEQGSHGYVAFKIKSKSNLVLGNVIQNKADIFFDYNFPIVTNTTSTTVAVLHLDNFENNSVSIAPIPVTNELQIKALENITLVQLFDIQGRLLQTKVADSMDATLDFSGKSKGVYLVKVQTEKGIKVQKVIKE